MELKTYRAICILSSSYSRAAYKLHGGFFFRKFDDTLSFPFFGLNTDPKGNYANFQRSMNIICQNLRCWTMNTPALNIFFSNFVAILLCAHLLACKKITARDRASKIIGFTCVCLTFSGYFKEKFTEGSINKSDILFLWATPYQFFSAIQIECLSNRNSETVEIVISWKCRTIAIHSYILKEFFELECLQFHFPVA